MVGLTDDEKHALSSCIEDITIELMTEDYSISQAVALATIIEWEKYVLNDNESVKFPLSENQVYDLTTWVGEEITTDRELKEMITEAIIEWQLEIVQKEEERLEKVQKWKVTKDDPLRPLLESLLNFEHLFNLSYDYADNGWYEDWSPRQTKPPWSQLEDWEGNYYGERPPLAPSECFLDVVNAIYKLGDKRAVEPLKEAGFEVYAFQLLGDVDGLISCLGKDIHISDIAADALAEIGDIKALKPIIRLEPRDFRYWEEDNERYSVSVPCAGFGAPAIAPLIKELGNSQPCWIYTTDFRAVAALSMIEDSLWSDISLDDATYAVMKILEKDKLWDDSNYGELSYELPGVTLCLATEVIKKIAKSSVRGKEKENILKFLESRDEGTVRMGASMLKGILEE